VFKHNTTDFDSFTKQKRDIQWEDTWEELPILIGSLGNLKIYQYVTMIF
jgi:hypothetical protein